MGTHNFVFVILNVVLPPLLDITYFLVQFNSRWILKLIKGISNDCQKLLRYFNGTAPFTFFNTPLPLTGAGYPKTLDLYLNDGELFVVTLSEFPATGDLSLLHYIGIIMSRLLAVSICSSFIWVTHSVNGAQFLMQH